MRIAIDFGNTHTVVSARLGSQPAEILTLPGLAFPDSALISSLISYSAQGSPLIGFQVLAADRLNDAGTFRWMKRYIALNSPYHLRIGSERVLARQAAERFLSEIIAAIESRIAPEPIEVLTFTVPVDSFDNYRDWLKGAFESVRRPVRVVDEISAAAASANVNFTAGEAAFVLDIGGSTQQALIVVCGADGELISRGKSGRSGGGSDIDRWLFEAVCAQAGTGPNDPCLRRHGAALIQECERLKIALSSRERAEITPDGNLAAVLPRELTFERAELETILDRRGFLSGLERMIHEVRQQAAANGVDLSRITKMFFFGGTTMIPRIARIAAGAFPTACQVGCDPLRGVALGALRLDDGGFSIRDMITHEYAIRYRDGRSGENAFRTIVPALTPFPSVGVAVTLRLKATRAAQRYFGLAIYERSLNPDAGEGSDPFEILFDETGAVRIMKREERGGRTAVFLNPRAARFIEADPPADRGETRFSVTFEVDADRFLRVSADDLRSGRRVLERVPVVRLN